MIFQRSRQQGINLPKREEIIILCAQVLFFTSSPHKRLFYGENIPLFFPLTISRIITYTCFLKPVLIMNRLDVRGATPVYTTWGSDPMFSLSSSHFQVDLILQGIRVVFVFFSCFSLFLNR